MPIETLGVKLYTLKEASEVIGVSYTTMKTYHASGKVRGQRVGRSVMVTEEELRRFVSAGQRTTAGSELSGG